jgi:alpha-tubulin suppressor-like RCC1 family protein
MSSFVMANSATSLSCKLFFRFCFVFVCALGLQAAFPLRIPERPTTFPLERPAEVGWIETWGVQDFATLTPDGTYGYVAIASGPAANAALRPDGTVAIWATGTFSTNLPPEATNIVAISLGTKHGLVLRADGKVIPWGDNEYGQTNLPPDLTNVVAIEAGAYHSMVLRADGTVGIWGRDISGVLNVPTEATNVVSIGLGLTHAGVLRADGKIILWGDPANGQTTLPPGLTDVAVLEVGPAHNVVLRSDGTGASWGYNSSFQATLPTNFVNNVAVSAAFAHNAALRADGTVITWGLGAPRPPLVGNVFAISAAENHNMLLHRTGQLFVADARVTVQNGFVVSAIIEHNGNGYMSPPVVTLVGGGGAGAQVVATISSGKVIALTVTSAGSGYTSAPEVRISPPEGFAPEVTLAITHQTLTLQVSPGNKYQLESSTNGTSWVAVGAPFISQSATITQEVQVTVPPLTYRLRQIGAAGTAVRVNGFITAINVTEGGAGYVSAPAVTFVGGNGSGAAATANISNGAVTSFTVTSAGSGYTATPQVLVDPPPAAPGKVAVSPSRVDIAQTVVPGLKYQLDATTDLNSGWAPVEPASIVSTNRVVHNFVIADGNRFFRTQQIP